MRKTFLMTLIFAAAALFVACATEQTAVPAPNVEPQAASRPDNASDNGPAQSSNPDIDNAASAGAASIADPRDANTPPPEHSQAQESSVNASNSTDENNGKPESVPPITETIPTQASDSLAKSEAEPPSSENEPSVGETESSNGEESRTVTAKAVDLEAESSETEDPAHEDSPDPLSEEFFLRVVSPEEDTSFVESPFVEVAGLTPLDAAVSVNDDLIDVDEDGRFGATVELEEGPNIIEVVASNSDGEEEDVVLTVFYIP